MALKLTTAPLHYGAAAVYPKTPGMEAMLTFTNRFGEQVKMYKDLGNTIAVPRGLVARNAVSASIDHRSWGPKMEPVVPALKARNADQQQALDSIVALLKAQVDHLVEAPTGFGKTFLGVATALLVNLPTLIVVTKEDLIKSWRAMLHNSPDHPSEPGMGLPYDCAGHLQGAICNWQGKRFVIGMVHSLAKDGKYDSEVFRHFGLVIFDECHRLGADSFQELCYKVPGALRLGLSATPDRSDGKERVFQAHIGPVMVRGETVPMKPRILRKNTGWSIPEGLPYGPGKMMLVNKQLGKSPTRNKIIVDFTLQALAAGRTVVIMSDLIDGHLKILFHALCSAGVSGEDIGYYISQKTNDKAKAAAALDWAKTRKVVLATFAMTKEGTNVPHWDTLVLASPRADVKQAIGRVMRMMKDKKTPVVLDLIDHNSIFKTYGMSRLKQYYSVGAEIVEM